MTETFHSGKRLALLRQFKDWSQENLAVVLGNDERTIRRWEKQGMPNRILAEVADIFEIELWFLTDENLSEQDFKKICSHCPQSTENFKHQVGKELEQLEECGELQILDKDHTTQTNDHFPAHIDFLIQLPTKSSAVPISCEVAILCHEGEIKPDVFDRARMLKMLSPYPYVLIITEAKSHNPLIKCAQGIHLPVICFQELEDWTESALASGDALGLSGPRSKSPWHLEIQEALHDLLESFPVEESYLLDKLYLKTQLGAYLTLAMLDSHPQAWPQLHQVAQSILVQHGESSEHLNTVNELFHHNSTR